MESGLQGYMDYAYLLEQVKDYQSPKAKITTMIKSGEIIRVRRGLYVPGQANSYEDLLYEDLRMEEEDILAMNLSHFIERSCSQTYLHILGKRARR